MADEIIHLYGSSEADLDALSALVGGELGLKLEVRDSSYWGDHYIDRSGAFTELRLYRNRDPMFRPDNDDPDEYWLQPEFKDCSTLLSVYAPVAAVKEFANRFDSFESSFRLLTSPIKD